MESRLRSVVNAPRKPQPFMRLGSIPARRCFFVSSVGGERGEKTSKPATRGRGGDCRQNVGWLGDAKLFESASPPPKLRWITVVSGRQVNARENILLLPVL